MALRQWRQSSFLRYSFKRRLFASKSVNSEEYFIRSNRCRSTFIINLVLQSNRFFSSLSVIEYISFVHINDCFSFQMYGCIIFSWMKNVEIFFRSQTNMLAGIKLFLQAFEQKKTKKFPKLFLCRFFFFFLSVFFTYIMFVSLM